MTRPASLAVGGDRRARNPKALAAALVGGALLSKVLGLVREVLVARVIGASLVADSFRGSMSAILLPLVVLQNESVPAVLIPSYREWTADGDAPRRFAALTVALVLVATLLFLLVEAVGPLWIDLLLAGFSETARAQTLGFTRVMALAMPASVLLCCLSATEIARGQSRITAIRATMVNVSVILGVLVLLLTGWSLALAWGFSLAFNLVAAWALVRVIRDGALDPRGIGPAAVWRELRLYFVRLRPMLLQPAAEQAQVWIERLLASALAVGTLSSLDYARTLSDCATLLIGQPIGLAVLSVGLVGNTKAQLDALSRPVLAVTLPASVFLVVFAPEVVQTVFQGGAFKADAIASTSRALQGIAPGLWATTLGWILVRMLNNAGRNGRATVAVALAYLANGLSASLLVDSLGGFALGFGEAVRGLVLLCGVSLALGCGRHMVHLLLLALPAAAALAVAALAIRAGVDGIWPRLLTGGAATALAVAASLWVMVPRVRGEVRRFIVARQVVS